MLGMTPASSTPVGPPPTMTNVSQRLLLGGVAALLRFLERAQEPMADMPGVLERLQPGARGSHSGWLKYEWREPVERIR